jgi:glucose-6-phosphate isomerase
MLEAAFWKDDLPTYHTIATLYKKFDNVLIIGMGGASAGGKALVSLFQSWVRVDSSFPIICFLDNLDPEIFWELMSLLNPKTTGVLVISPSGETPATLQLCMRCLEYWQTLLSPQEISAHFTTITTPNSSLGRITQHFHLTSLAHPPSIGGRFSCLSLVGLLPLMLVGGEARKVRAGAAAIIREVFAGQNAAPIEAAAAQYALYRQGLSAHVMMPYGDAFVQLADWWRHLTSESLGKQGHGLLPVCALGSRDQHNQLQLYLDGPKDKVFTLLSEQKRPREHLNPALWRNFPELDFLSKTTLDQLLWAEEETTYRVMVQRGCPTRRFILKTLSEEAMGALLAHLMLETLILAALMGVNALDQPAADSLAVLARRFLEENTMPTEKAGTPIPNPVKTEPQIYGQQATAPHAPVLAPTGTD